MSQELTGLTLTRYQGQRVVIGDAIVEVIQVAGGRVKLRILAPKNMPINREEVIPQRASTR